MNLIQCYLIANDCYKTGRTINPKGVMVHSTGANNPKIARYVQPTENQANRDAILQKVGTNRNQNDWNNPGMDVCTHAFVGEFADGSVGTTQTMPWNHRGWHAGTGTSGNSANNTHISFEICEDALTDADYFQKVYQEAVELTAMLCKTYKLDPLADGVVICHSEGYQRGIASNHADVMHWFPKFGKSMDTFRTDVSKAMGTTQAKPQAPATEGVANTAQEIVKGSTVRLKQGAKTYDGGSLASFVYDRDHVVSEVSGDRCVITYNGVVVAAVRKSDLTLVSGGASTPTPTTPSFTPYTVKVSVTELRIRSGPGTNTDAKGFIQPGVYTIVEEANGPGAKRWGKLKSGAGWISLDYAKKV